MDPGPSEGNGDAAHGMRHMKDAEHQGIVAASQRLLGYCCRSRMEVHLTEFIKQCLHCMGRDLAKFCILTSCTMRTSVPWVKIDYMRETGSGISCS